MTDNNQVIYDIERCICNVPDACMDCSKYKEGLSPFKCMEELMKNALVLLKEQQEVIVTLAMNKEKADQTREIIKPAVDEFGNAYCICGEHVGFYPQIDKTLPKIRLNYCHSCGRKLVWK